MALPADVEERTMAMALSLPPEFKPSLLYDALYAVLKVRALAFGGLSDKA